jgi:CRISPR/Cas system-associated endonuclease Cas1
MREYPSTTEFPSRPGQLSRDQLEAAYLELRRNYKGLSVSRGQFAARTRNLQAELIKQNEEFQQLMQRLSELASEKQELQEVMGELEAVSRRQQALVSELRDEFEFVRDDRGNLLDKFNRMMRAIYRFLNPDRPIVPVKPPTDDDTDTFSASDPASINRSLRENKD